LRDTHLLLGGTKNYRIFAMQPQIIWDEFLKIAKEEAGSQVVETWFKAVTLDKINIHKQEVTLKMPNNFVSNWIQEHYMSLLKTHLRRLLNIENIHIIFAAIAKQKPEATPSSPHHTTLVSKPMYQPATIAPPSNTQLIPHTAIKKKEGNSTLNEAYQFDTFVVGPSNSLAHGAAYAVSQSLGTVYNPLFIYGGTGLGKTHLLHAIGREVKRQNKFTRVRYETSDKFMRNFIQSIRFDKAHLFRERYQQIDLLLLDDIQFFSNKEQTQETFFHIFNTLYEQKKQIVLSSDTFPEEIKGLQRRLTSRMEWGLVADMQIPDLETKIAILNKKADSHNIRIDEEVCTFIAQRIHSNIRQLEGALIRVEAFASLTGQKISLSLAKRVLLNFKESKNQPLELTEVATIIAKFYGTTVNEIKSKKRSKDIASIRQIACYFMKKHTAYSLQSIGNFFNGRDHSTIIHAVSKVEKHIEKDRYFAQKIKHLEQEITQR